MTATQALEELTLLPEHYTEIAALRAYLDEAPDGARPAILRGPEGVGLALPSEVYEALLAVVHAMAQGRAVTVAPVHTTLTTQEAADLLGISRPTLVKLLDEGEIAHSRPGRHRRVLLTDVLDYRETRRRRRRAGLQSLVEVSEDLGLYDLPAE